MVCKRFEIGSRSIRTVFTTKVRWLPTTSHEKPDRKSRLKDHDQSCIFYIFTKISVFLARQNSTLSSRESKIFGRCCEDISKRFRSSYFSHNSFMMESYSIRLMSTGNINHDLSCAIMMFVHVFRTRSEPKHETPSFLQSGFSMTLSSSHGLLRVQ